MIVVWKMGTQENPSSFGLPQFSIGGTRLQPQRASMREAATENIARSLGDAAISVVLPMSSPQGDNVDVTLS